MHKRSILVAATALLLLAVSAPAAHALTKTTAKAWADAALFETLGGGWEGREGDPLNCRRLSRNAFRCQARWVVGDGSYSARLRSRLLRGGASVVGSVRLIDQYCVYVTRTGDCVRTIPVRWDP